ncbi:MAG TPA: TIGR00730 family Rossman fold protein [Nitrospinota bacterium]|mgnify:CR=1 FL=1|nr:TIGR00730 family Rossman fold protein [Nitrospinota bacterium]|tara:strand:+ start:3793 stop:4365 length:573 start_codon:yes stop_codon:yes gene_type:complete
MKIKSICVYCASNRQSPEKWLSIAKQVGEELAKRNIMLVYGGGSIGLMGEIADTVIDLGGTVTGVITEMLNTAEVGHKGLDKLISTVDMHERKKTMFELSDAFIALPGGFGTMEEILEIITWKHLGIHIKPVIIVNEDGYYNGLFSQLNRCAKEGLMHDGLDNLFKAVITISEAFELIDNLNSQSTEFDS